MSENKSSDKNIDFEISRNFNTWLSQENCSIICTSYKTNLVFTFSRVNNNNITVWCSKYERPMELCVENKLIHLGTQLGIVSFINNTDESITKDGVTKIKYNHNYVANNFKITGDIDIHDIYVLNNTTYFVSSQLNSICIIKPETKFKNFEIFWTPAFITKNKHNKIPFEDRCHLNSCCVVNNKIKYAAMMSDSDILGGWRDNRVGGGLIVDVETDEIICSNLCMPHSLNYYNNKLYVLDSGTGRFGYIDFDVQDTNNRFVEITFIPGFLRGLKFINNYAVIGSSLDRHEKVFSELPLSSIMKEKKIAPKCGVKIVNINTGDIVHSIELKNVIEIYGIGIVEDSDTTRLLDLQTESLVNAIKY